MIGGTFSLGFGDFFGDREKKRVENRTTNSGNNPNLPPKKIVKHSSTVWWYSDFRYTYCTSQLSFVIFFLRR